MLILQNEGAHNINFVSPSHMVFQMADAIVEAKKIGLSIPVVYNSNGYDSVNALIQIKGLVDIYIPDIKYMENTPGKKFSSAKHYPNNIEGVLTEMLRQVGHLEVTKDGIATRGLLVRHLVLPGFIENSRKCLRTVAELSQDTHISIMSQYSPQYKACNYPEINRTLTHQEYDALLDYALAIGLENVFIQEMESQHNYLPDFSLETPFQ